MSCLLALGTLAGFGLVTVGALVLLGMNERRNK